MTSEELRDKLDYLFTQIGVQTAPWAKTLLKTAQSKNIDIAEWNTFVYKVATVAASTDVLVQIAETVAKNFANITGGDGEGSVQSKSSTATADYAMALGKGLVASVEALAAFGRYNLADPSALLVVGNGTDDENRNNAFTVHADGTVSAGEDGTKDLDLITKRQLVQAQTTLNQALTDAQAAIAETISKLQDEVDGHEATMLAFHNRVFTENNGKDDDSLIEQLQIAIQAIDALIPKDNPGTQADESAQATKNKLVLRDANGRAYVEDAIVKLETLKNANPDCVINVNVLRNELAKKLDIDKSANGFYKAYGTDSRGNPAMLNVLTEAGTNTGSLMSQYAITDLAEYGTGRNISVSGPKNLVLTEYDTYAEVGDNTSVEFEDSSNYTITTVEIPIKYKRKPVVCVASKAFMKNPHVERLITYDGLFEIGGGAFNGCSKLRTVVLANSIRRIGFQAFINCDMLTHIVLPKSLEYLENMAFYNAPLEGIITIPHTCVSIGGNVGQVFNMKSISAIVFEGTPRWLHPAAFTGCKCDIYVPWSKGEVTEATDGTAWGSTGTVHYNYRPDLVAIGKLAETADKTANTASKTATEANTTASTANTIANTATKTANSALTKAESALTTANTAKSTADGIASTANSALSVANTAKSTADGISSTANSALSTATEAHTAVGEADKTHLIFNATKNSFDTMLDYNSIYEIPQSYNNYPLKYIRLYVLFREDAETSFTYALHNIFTFVPSAYLSLTTGGHEKAVFSVPCTHSSSSEYRLAIEIMAKTSNTLRFKFFKVADSVTANYGSAVYRIEGVY